MVKAELTWDRVILYLGGTTRDDPIELQRRYRTLLGEYTNDEVEAWLDSQPVEVVRRELDGVGARQMATFAEVVERVGESRLPTRPDPGYSLDVRDI